MTDLKALQDAAYNEMDKVDNEAGLYAAGLILLGLVGYYGYVAIKRITKNYYNKRANRVELHREIKNKSSYYQRYGTRRY